MHKLEENMEQNTLKILTQNIENPDKYMIFLGTKIVGNVFFAAWTKIRT